MPTIAIDDPYSEDIRALLGVHIAFNQAMTPATNYTLGVDALAHDSVSLFSYRDHGELLAIGALKQLDEDHGEIKSVHTAEAARGRGIGRALVEHVIAVSRKRGYRTLNLETAPRPAYRPAIALYLRLGFTYCGPFADYPPDNPGSVYMELAL